MNTVNLVEVFSSIQGEGILIGEYQVFIRFANCNLKCLFCDTPQALFIPPDCKIYNPSGLMIMTNPIKIPYLINMVKDFKISAVSITGGEPLLQPSAIVDLASSLHISGFKIFLNTNGTLLEALFEVIELIDVIGMDIKLFSCSGVTFNRDMTFKFLELANHKETFVKVVLTNKVREEEFMEIVSLIKEINRYIPLIIQPVTHSKESTNDYSIPPSLKMLCEFYQKAVNQLSTVRIIPQVHYFESWK